MDKQHSFVLNKNSKLTQELVEQVDNLFLSSTPQEYRDTLIEIYHMYICHESPDFPHDFKRMAGRMYFLIEFFKVASEEMENHIANRKEGYRS